MRKFIVVENLLNKINEVSTSEEINPCWYFLGGVPYNGNMYKTRFDEERIS